MARGSFQLMRYITVEEHFASPAFLAGPGREFTERLRHSRGARIVEQLQDVGGKRIAEMDAAGIDMQVISLNAPGVEQADADVQVSVARDANDLLAEAVRQHPLRLVHSRHCRSPLLKRQRMSSISGFVSRGSRAHSSMAIRAAVISTTNSSRQFWHARKL